MASPTNAGTLAPGAPAKGPAVPPFKTETFASQLLWLAIFFGLLYWLVAKVFAPRLQEAMEGRSSRIAKDLDDAAAAKAKAEAAGEAYERALAEAKAKAQAIGQKQRDEVNVAIETRRKGLEADLAAKLAAAEAQIAASKSAAMANVSDIASEAAAVIVERLSGETVARPKVDAAVQSVLKG